MFFKEYIPKLYIDFIRKKYIDMSSDNYIWLYELEWMTESDVINYEYEEGESVEILPFAFTGHGDKWVFVNNNSKEPYVGRCYLEDTEGCYYAKNFEDAIIKNILEFVSSSSFYVDESNAAAYQMSRDELQFYLEKYSNSFEGMIKHSYIQLINDLKKRTLKSFSDDYCEWHALLSVDESNDLIKSYLDFELLDKEFLWHY